ncbi:MAG: SH3 domain-containing protein [Deltaproteobacteria bacterium]|nr:SH3 domain-containing protein [Deltaproteobacteria bacterium]
MKYQNQFLRTFVAAGTAAALLASPLLCRADDEISVEQIRRELRQAAGTETERTVPTTIGKDFALSDKDIEAENSRLEAQEAELLKKLSSPEAQALIKDVASGKTEPLPTAASLALTGREAADQAAAVAATARAETQISEKSAPELETVVVSRTIKKIEVIDTAPKAALKAAPVDATVKAASVKADRAKTDAQKEADAREASLKALTAQVATLRRANTDLSAKLQKSDLQINDLSKQLEHAKNRLMLAETEVERLAGSIDARNRSAAMKFSGATNAAAGSAPASNVAPAVQRSSISKASDDTPVATVIAEKANLRTGPGADNSPLMSVTRGTRLVVETKQGDWYRVVSPTGTRAWVSSDVVAFGPNSMSSPTRTVRIKGYDASVQSENFDLTKSAQ